MKNIKSLLVLTLAIVLFGCGGSRDQELEIKEKAAELPVQDRPQKIKDAPQDFPEATEQAKIEAEEEQLEGSFSDQEEIIPLNEDGLPFDIK